MNKKNITGILLAGGKSSRMGTDKGLMKLRGKTFVEHILDALVPVVDEILIIANDAQYLRFGYPVYADIIKGCGPMGGVYTGLKNSSTDKNLIVSCDIPFITTQMLSSIIDKSGDTEITIPEYEGKLEPLCAIYTKGCAERFRLLLEEKEWKMKEALSHFTVTKVKFSNEVDVKKIFININTPYEFHQANKQVA